MILLILYIGFVTLLFSGLIAIDMMGGSKKGKIEKKESTYEPRALIIVPCKGIDMTLKENLTSISSQKYKDYSVVAVVDSKSDPAMKIINQVGIKHIISSAECSRCSNKVRAISTAIETFRDYEIYVIADSDISVDGEWLRSIVAPLEDRSIGISTMYPYFNPVKGFWSKVKLVWGFVGEGMMENEATRFGWGGALAFRKGMMDDESMKFFKDSEYSVSDDICLTKIARSRKLKVAYTSNSQPKVNSSESLGSFVEWSNRQTALSILGYKRNFYLGIAFYSAEIIVMISAILLTVYVYPIFIIFLAHTVKSVIKTYRRAHRMDIEIGLIAILMPFIYLVNLIYASRMKSITWRGNAYILHK